MNSLTPVIGIDFGTTNSKMAWYNPGTEQAEVLKNDEGEDETPSVVYFGEKEILVGTPAIEMLEDEQAWERVIVSVKRSMVNAPVINLPDRVVKPVEVAAEILRKLKRDAEDLQFHQELRRAVITYPASFDGLERDEIKKAAELAGFSEVELLTEPQAAALAYTQMRITAGFRVGNHVLIYDLGGGTFDLAVLVREGNEPFRLGLEPQGIKQCGGDDFDEALYTYCDKLALEKLGRPISLTGERDLHFFYECRKRKENLTTHKRRIFSSLLAPDSVSFKYEIDQETFENLIRDKVEQTVRKTRAMLEQARTTGYEIETFILVGGSSRVPLVKRLLDENLPLKAMAWQHREVAVALGAAYYAHNKWKHVPLEQAETQYRRAVEAAWANKKLNQTEVDRLGTLATRLGLSKERAASVEREVMGDTREGTLVGQMVRDQYRRAVEAAWANKKLNQTEVDRLGTLATRLGLSKERAATIESEVMGDTKEEVLARQSGPEIPGKPGDFTLAKTLTGHANIVWCVAISPDGQTLASSSEDNTIRLWNLRTGELLRTVAGHTGGVYAVAISPDGQLLASGSADRTIKVWNLRTGVLLHTFTGQSGWLVNVTSLATSPDGRLLASGSRDKTIKFWNLSSGVLLRPLTGHTDVVWCVAFSPDGQLLASGSADRTVKLWNLRTGKLIRSFTGQLGSVQSVAFSPNGQLLGSGGSDQIIRFWNLRTGAPLRPLVGHIGMVDSIVFSPDGQFLASGGFDRTMRLWNLRTGTLLRSFTEHAGGVHSVTFSPDGQTLASGSADTTIKIWRKT